MAGKVHDWVRNAFTRNKAIKLLALALAILTLHSIRSATKEEDSYVVPIEPVLTEPSIEVVEQDPLSARVTLRGSREDLRRIDPKHLKAVVRLRQGKDETISIRERDIEGRYATRVVKIEPAVARFTLARRAVVEKAPPEARPADPEMPVVREWTNVVITALVEPSGELSSLIVEPPTVNVSLRGAAADISSIRTPLVFVDGAGLPATGAVERLVRVHTAGERIAIVSVQPDRARVRTGKLMRDDANEQ
ncbi:MAG: hypothetical protein QME60_06595 [Verrucomicrobiota bacterium]|nr:hypothetical protein [Verrucomicrobiota bacterium]